MNNLSKPERQRCSKQPCEIVISSLQQAADQNPADWALQYQLGICYSGRCHHHSLISSDLALEHLRSAWKTLQPEEPLTLAAILNLLGIVYLKSATLPTKARMLTAIECHQKAAAIYFERGAFAEWARMQYNLGNTCCELPNDEFPDKWEDAISHYEQALLFRTRHADRDAWVATLENLGTAYRQRLRGDKSANIRTAIGCYRRALHLCTVKNAPAHWAALHNNLGNAYMSMPFAEKSTGCSYARHAIRHFDLALTVRTRELNVFDYGVTRLNRGQACLQLGLAGSPAWLKEALQCLREAHVIFLGHGGDMEAQLAEKSLRLASEALRELRNGHAA
jgi:tetratricopeptide (TPR) repeat protein